MFYQCFFFFFFLFFFAALSPSSLTGTQSYPATWSEVSAIWKYICEIWGFISPTNRGPKKPPFWRFRNLRATLAAYTFRTKHDIHKRQVRCKLRGVSYIVSKRHELWSTNGFKWEVSFHPPSVNSAFHFIARLRRRRSANGTLPNFAKQWKVGPANNLP